MTSVLVIVRRMLGAFSMSGYRHGREGFAEAPAGEDGVVVSCDSEWESGVCFGGRSMLRPYWDPLINNGTG
jgi:hypothetical protein